MLFIAVFGQWTAAMVTLSSIVIAVPLGAVLGLLLGVLGYRVPLVEKAITPVLDLMQTVPVFAYLVPVLFLFGFGPTSAIVATIIYAMPPMTRLTLFALRGVPAEIDELGRMVGATPRQRTWKVLIPAATPGLMVGLNQVIMLSLNIVIIASMIGAGGLGFEVLGALRRLDFGVGLEAGFAIVALAVVLDRLSQAVAIKLQIQTHRRAAHSPVPQAPSLRRRGGRAGPRDRPARPRLGRLPVVPRRVAALDRRLLGQHHRVDQRQLLHPARRRSRTSCCSTCWCR